MPQSFTSLIGGLLNAFPLSSCLRIIWILFTGTGYAQTFTGTLDGYWSYNTNTPAFQLNSFRAFDIRAQAFSLNYGELAVAYKPNDVGFRVDVGFGDAADIVLRNTGDSQTWRHIQQSFPTHR